MTLPLSDLLLLPRGRQWALFDRHDPEGAPVHTLPWSADVPAILTPEGRLFAATRSGRRLSSSWLDEGRVTEGAAFAVPQGWRIRGFAAAGCAVYGGGEGDGSLLIVRDTRAPEDRWNRVPLCLPHGHRKAIDALLVDGDRLYAVDNFVLPKYVVVLDIGDPTGPVQTDCVALHCHGTYEHIVGAAQDPQRIAVLSTTIGEIGAAAHVAIYRKPHLQHEGSLSLGYGRSGTAGATTVWKAVGLLPDALVIAAGRGGVGLVRLRPPAPIGQIETARYAPPNDLGIPAFPTPSKKRNLFLGDPVYTDAAAFKGQAIVNLRLLPAGGLAAIVERITGLHTVPVAIVDGGQPLAGGGAHLPE